MSDTTRWTISNFATKRWADVASDEEMSLTLFHKQYTKFNQKIQENRLAVGNTKNVSEEHHTPKTEGEMKTQFPEGFVSLMQIITQTAEKPSSISTVRRIPKSVLLAYRFSSSSSSNSLSLKSPSVLSSVECLEKLDGVQHCLELQPKKAPTFSKPQVSSPLEKELSTFITSDHGNVWPLIEKNKFAWTNKKDNPARACHNHTLSCEGSFLQSKILTTSAVSRPKSRVSIQSSFRSKTNQTLQNSKPIQTSTLHYRERQIAIEKSGRCYYEYIQHIPKDKRSSQCPVTPRLDYSSNGEFQQALHQWRHQVRRYVDTLKLASCQESH